MAWCGAMHGEQVCLHNAPLSLACSPWAAHTLLMVSARQPLPVTSGRQACALGHQDGCRAHENTWGHGSPQPQNAASILRTQIDQCRRGSAGVKGGISSFSTTRKKGVNAMRGTLRCVMRAAPRLTKASQLPAAEPGTSAA